MREEAATSRFAVRSVVWRNCIDWIVRYIPAIFHPFLVFVAAAIFFFVAADARRTVLSHLQILFPASPALRNWLRAFSVFHHFGWSLADGARYRIDRVDFRYEVKGSEFLDQLRTVRSAIVLTAHMGNYDLGSSVFVEKIGRPITTVRAPEPDAAAGAHLQRSIDESAAGGVQVQYNTGASLLSFDLLNQLRQGGIVSIQGDRSMGEVAQSAATMSGRPALLPSGPIVLSLTAEVPIFPVFILRLGHRRYRFLFLEPFHCERSGKSREADISNGVQHWADVLSEVIKDHWSQWYAFTPVFRTEA